MAQYTIQVPVSSTLPRDRVQNLIDMLILRGLAECEQRVKDCPPERAQDALEATRFMRVSDSQ